MGKTPDGFVEILDEKTFEKDIPPGLQAKIAAVDPENSQRLLLSSKIIKCLGERDISHAKTEWNEKLIVTVNGVKKIVFVSFTKNPGPGVPGSVVSGKSKEAINKVLEQLQSCAQTPGIVVGFAPKLPKELGKTVAEYVPVAGKRRTRKGKKRSKKTRKVKRSL
jgi:hypothetical protein